MIIKRENVGINTENVTAWRLCNEEQPNIEFREPGGEVVVRLEFDSIEMAQDSIAMIYRHLSRGRSVCNLDLLEEFNKRGHIVLLTEIIRRTINRIAGRLGL